PLIGPFVLKTNVEVGVITSRQPEGVPITERYILGGINDIRGFRPRTLSPVILVQAPGAPDALTQIQLGGNMELVLNTEIEFPLFQKVGISGVVFFDAGNAYNLEGKWCNREAAASLNLNAKIDPCFDFPRSIIQGARTSVGFGFRWVSPIRPLGLEWGVPLVRLSGEDALVFGFTIGHVFYQEPFMKRVFWARALAGGTAGAAPPPAAKIGYIDLQRTLNETKVGKAAKAKLESD